MVELQQVSWWKTTFGKREVKNISEAIWNGNISMGTITKKFEEQISKLLGVPYVVATPSGSAALNMTMLALGIGPGDEVIIPNRTWIATAHAPLLVNATVVPVDVLEEEPSLDIDKVKNAITPKTKAIIPVHLSGRSVDMRQLNNLAKKHEIKVIEDACQSFLSSNEDGFLGTQSDAGCFSFAITKMISTGQGGAIVTHNKDLYQKLKLIRWHGTNNNIKPKYTYISSNYKFTDMLASLGIQQLARVPDKIKHLKSVYKMYEEGLRDLSFIQMIPVNLERGEIPLYIEVISELRERIIPYLENLGIQIRTFLPNIDSAPYIDGIADNFPNSTKFSNYGFFLPCGPNQDFEKVQYVIDSIHKFGDTL